MRTLVLLLLLSGCTVSHMTMNRETGCWKGKGNKVCGEAVEYDIANETYVMETKDGWRMKVPAVSISWKDVTK